MGDPTALSELANLINPPTPGDPAGFAALEQVVDRLHREGNHLAAGYGWETGAMLAWGTPHDYSRAIKSAATEYLEAVRAAEKCSARELAAAIRLFNVSIRRPPSGLGAHRDVAAAALDELANLILSCTTLVPGNAHLVRGLWLRTDFDQQFNVVVPAYEIEWGHETGGPDYRQFSVPSPFQLFIETADYAGALSIAAECPEAFSSPGLRGWRAAALGFTDRIRAAEHFAEAATEFAADLPPTGGVDPDRGVWTSRNVDLWAPYFRARSLLAKVIREPAEAREYIRLASDLMPVGAAGWVDTDVQRFRALLACLRQLIDPDADVPLVDIRREFVGAVKLGGPAAGDAIVDRFIPLLRHRLWASLRLRRRRSRAADSVTHSTSWTDCRLWNQVSRLQPR